MFGPVVRAAPIKATAVAVQRERRIMKAKSDPTLVHNLLELVAALDRRVPRLEREGERDIARDAQALRRAALKRIAELERSVCGPSPAQTSCH
jgi:hypothetical protein